MMAFFVIAVIIGSILAILISIDGITNEELEKEKLTELRIENEVNKRLNEIKSNEHSNEG